MEASTKYVWFMADDDLPLKHNVKSYFNELADKHDISFRRIKQIAEENRPDNSSK